MTYRKQIYLGLVGVAICAMPVVLPVVPQIATYAEAQRYKAEKELLSQNLQADEEFQRDRIAEGAKTSNKLYEAGIAPTTTKLRIRRYFDTPKRDPKPDTTGWGADEVVYVYDSARKCIGRIEENRWLWKHRYSDACEGRPS